MGAELSKVFGSSCGDAMAKFIFFEGKDGYTENFFNNLAYFLLDTAGRYPTNFAMGGLFFEKKDFKLFF
jgi:hypothetical protein